MTAMALPTPLRRHQLAWLTDAGWCELLARDWDATARACLAHWAARRLPLVVTRQRDEGDQIALGLAAPGRWQRRRLAVGVPRGAVSYFGEFPSAEQVVELLPARRRSAWRKLCAELHSVGACSRVYGSYGWQKLTGLDHVRAGSDLDLWLTVRDAEQADAVTERLQSFTDQTLRLDGELMFSDGSAVAWREWRLWRANRAKALLVKSITGAALVRESDWQDATALEYPA